MSKGLSVFQRKILKKLNKKGIISIFDIYRLHFKPRQRFKFSPQEHLLWRKMMDADEDLAFDFEGHREEGTEVIRSMRNVASLYRTMKSLERRGLVGAITNVQPRCWVKIEEWIDGKPLLSELVWKYTHTKFILAKMRKGWIIRSLDGQRWKITKKIHDKKDSGKVS